MNPPAWLVVALVAWVMLSVPAGLLVAWMGDRGRRPRR